jgi:anti-anti-sigma factor
MDLSKSVHADWTVCRVAGDVDIFTGFALREHLIAALDRPGRRLLVDLSGVTFMDAGGLGILIFTQRMAESRGGWIRLVAPTAGVRRLLMLTGLTDSFSISEDLVSAQQAVLSELTTERWLEPPRAPTRYNLTQV